MYSNPSSQERPGSKQRCPCGCSLLLLVIVTWRLDMCIACADWRAGVPQGGQHDDHAEGQAFPAEEGWQTRDPRSQHAPDQDPKADAHQGLDH